MNWKVQLFQYLMLSNNTNWSSHVYTLYFYTPLHVNNEKKIEKKQYKSTDKKEQKDIWDLVHSRVKKATPCPPSCRPELILFSAPVYKCVNTIINRLQSLNPDTAVSSFLHIFKCQFN